VKISEYEIDLEEAVKTINKKNFKRVLLQIPEGLKVHVSSFVDYIEKNTKAEVIISANPCFGACDIAYYELNELDVDFLIHIGHTSIPELGKQKNVMFLNARSELDVTKVLEKAIPLLKAKKIGIVSTAQHAHKLEQVKTILRNKGFETFIGKGDSRIKLEGQILGCDFSSARSISKEVEMFLFIGSGNFHPLGLQLSTDKKVIACDPYTHEVKSTEDLKEMVLRQRYGAIARAKSCRIFGILIGTKKGQQRIDLALTIKEKLSNAQKKSYLLALDYFSPSVLETFAVFDCFVSTACPRIAIDDYMQYKKPILTPVELDILLNYKKWEDYSFDEIS